MGMKRVSRRKRKVRAKSHVISEAQRQTLLRKSARRQNKRRSLIAEARASGTDVGQLMLRKIRETETAVARRKEIDGKVTPLSNWSYGNRW